MYPIYLGKVQTSSQIEQIIQNFDQKQLPINKGMMVALFERLPEDPVAEITFLNNLSTDRLRLFEYELYSLNSENGKCDLSPYYFPSDIQQKGMTPLLLNILTRLEAPSACLAEFARKTI
ncbi:MAG: hypothetical protein HQK53_19490 [Oligoflexia bacterium]|nr:hypothetical protein [Oligoflexia bacterium]